MRKKNPHAVALGSKGGKAAAQNMTPEQRTERAKKAVAAREAKFSFTCAYCLKELKSRVEYREHFPRKFRSKENAVPRCKN